MGAARAALHRRCRACDVADGWRRRQSRRAGCGCDRQSAGAEARQGAPIEADLDAVQARREFPVKMTQRMQVVGAGQHRRHGAEAGDGQPLKAPLPLARDHRRALAAGHHRPFPRARRAPRACPFAGRARPSLSALPNASAKAGPIRAILRAGRAPLQPCIGPVNCCAGCVWLLFAPGAAMLQSKFRLRIELSLGIGDVS